MKYRLYYTNAEPKLKFTYMWREQLDFDTEEEALKWANRRTESGQLENWRLVRFVEEEVARSEDLLRH